MNPIGAGDGHVRDGGRAGVHLEAGVVCRARVGVTGVVACGVLEGAAVQAQQAVWDADAVDVVLTCQDFVAEHQLIAAAARDVVGLYGGATNVEGERWCAARGADKDDLTHRDRDEHLVAYVEIVVLNPIGAGDEHLADGGGCLINGHLLRLLRRVARFVGARHLDGVLAIGQARQVAFDLTTCVGQIRIDLHNTVRVLHNG